MKGPLVAMMACISLLFVASSFGQSDSNEQGERQSPEGASIEAFHAALIAAMQLEDFVAREQLIAPAVDKVFDVSRIAAISVGRTWRSLEVSQQEEFVGLLRELIIATFADRFSSYAGQRFETQAVNSLRAGVVVKTHLVRVDSSNVPLDYALRGGKVFNIVADGVSDLSLRRADYNSVIKRDGFAELLEHVRAKLNSVRSARGQP